MWPEERVYMERVLETYNTKGRTLSEEKGRIERSKVSL